MKLKYYLRGLGIGIIVTAIIMMIMNAGSGKPLTDEQIMERAEKLGMTRPEEDSEDSGEEDPEKKGAPSSIGVFSPEENQTAGDAQKPEETQLPENGEEANQSEDGEKDTKPEDSADPDGNADSETGDHSNEPAGEGAASSEDPEMVSIEISQGEYSDSVSRKLMEAGLISDAVDFNSYLVKNGMDNLLAVGVHQIPKGANYAEIAGALCKR